MPSVSDLLDSLDYGPAPESSASAMAWLKRHDAAFGHFIDGRWHPAPEAGSPDGFETRNPATGDVLARIRQGTEAEVDAAVAAATAAAPVWWALGGQARARILYALARGIQRHSRLFAVLESLDNGKPIRESRDIDVPLVARHFSYHAGWAAIQHEVFPDREPWGVVGQIIPWNFPLLMLAWKVAPALACGNTVVLKPAEYTPLTALLFADLCLEAGVPPGVFNLVTGDGRTGALLAAHPGVRKVAFTGSTAVGRALRLATAGSGKGLTLELGGKSPFMVYEDADLDSVVEGVVDAIWFNQGEVCCAGSRILVQESIAAELERRLRARMETLRVGDPLDKGMDMGAIVDPKQRDRIDALVTEGRRQGAEIWQPATLALPVSGAFYPPTLCTRVEPANLLAQEEIFGPVVVLMPFRTPAESVALANHTRYGLAASVWTENVNLALAIAPQLEAGTVWINCTNVFDAASGFGGVRESGFGREGGREGLIAYLRPAHSGAHDPAELQMAREHIPNTSVVRGPVSVSERTDRKAPLDRSPKLYVGGRQVRPDGGGSLAVVRRSMDVRSHGEHDARGESGMGAGDDTNGERLAGLVGDGNRKDVRNAVEAARKALPSWASSTAHLRSQLLFYLAENLGMRTASFIDLLRDDAGMPADAAEREVSLAMDRLVLWAGWADKVDGQVHQTPFRNVTLAMIEPVGVLGIMAPDPYPLLGLIGTMAPAIALGNTTVIVPSSAFPLAATEWIQVLETSDIPGGVVNLVTGLRAGLASTLSDHDDVDGLWTFGSPDEAADVERRSIGNLKRVWTPGLGGRGSAVVPGVWPWHRQDHWMTEALIEQSTRVKNVWVPYGT
jgi:aldehyde dehydrogenase (NAD+)